MNTAATKSIFPPRRLAAILALLWMAVVTPRGFAQASALPEVLAHGTAQRLYVGMAQYGEKPQTWIQYRTPEQEVWRPFLELDRPAISISQYGGEVVLLLENGDWRLAWDTGNRLGPPLPDKARILAIAGDDRHLFAVGRRPEPTQPPATAPAPPTTTPTTHDAPPPQLALFIMQPAGWAQHASLSEGLNPTQPSDLALIVVDGDPLLAVRKDKQIHVLRSVEAQWEPIAILDPAGAADFALLNFDGPGLWSAGAVGPGTIQPLDGDTDLALSAVEELADASIRAITTFDGDLHVVFAHDDKLAIQTYAPSGSPAAELQTLGPPHPEADPRISELIHLVVLAAMLFVLVTTLRQRKLDPIQPEELAKVQLAPAWPRFLAGLIDISPFLITMSVVFIWAQGTPDPAETMVQARAQLPVLLATIIYIAHTLTGELIFGRSLGKWILGLRVAALDGNRPTPTAIVMRNLLRIIDLVVIFPLPLLLILYTPMRQRLGDIAARTLVIRNDSAEDATDSEVELTPANPPDPDESADKT